MTLWRSKSGLPNDGKSENVKKIKGRLKCTRQVKKDKLIHLFSKSHTVDI